MNLCHRDLRYVNKAVNRIIFFNHHKLNRKVGSTEKELFSGTNPLTQSGNRPKYMSPHLGVSSISYKLGNSP